MKLDPKLQEKLGELFTVSSENLTEELPQNELPGALLVDIDQLLTTQQPRQYFEEAALKDLENSIRELHEAGKGIAGTGLLQPLLVRSASEESREGLKQYVVTAGERRLRAAKAAGLRQLPVIVGDSNQDDAWEQAIVENLLRADLSPLEEAQAIHKLMKSRGYSVREAARKLGKDKGYLENRLFLLKAPADVQKMVSARADTMRHARTISKVEDAAVRQKLISLSLAGASLAMIEEKSRQILNSKEQKASPIVQDNDLELLGSLSSAIEKIKSAVITNSIEPGKKDHFTRSLQEHAKSLQDIISQLSE